VIWVQHSDDDLAQGSDEWQYLPQLTRLATEPLVHKRWGDSFEETDLEALLSERKVGRLVVTGAQTDACIRSTLHGALARGYDATLVEDAHTTEDMREWGAPLSPDQAIAYTNMYWRWTKAPGCKGGTTATTDTNFAST
jgi:nicotinamidase-related amidase